MHAVDKQRSPRHKGGVAIHHHRPFSRTHPHYVLKSSPIPLDRTMRCRPTPVETKPGSRGSNTLRYDPTRILIGQSSSHPVHFHQKGAKYSIKRLFRGRMVASPRGNALHLFPGERQTRGKHQCKNEKHSATRESSRRSHGSLPGFCAPETRFLCRLAIIAVLKMLSAATNSTYVRDVGHKHVTIGSICLRSVYSQSKNRFVSIGS